MEGVYFIMRKGIWNDILSFFAQDCDVESIMIDGSIVRALACASGYKKDQQTQQALGRSKEGFTTKIHACVDALGNPLRFILTPGQNRKSSKLLNSLRVSIMPTSLETKLLIAMNLFSSLNRNSAYQLYRHDQAAKFKGKLIMFCIKKGILLSASSQKLNTSDVFSQDLIKWP
jgi:hypothetical protein